MSVAAAGYYTMAMMLNRPFLNRKRGGNENAIAFLSRNRSLAGERGDLFGALAIGEQRHGCQVGC
jgi:hypothetical protein